MTKKEISHETNELNYLFGGYFSAIGRLNIYHIKRKTPKCKINHYDVRISVSFDNMEFAKLFQQNFGGGICKDNRNKIPNWCGKKIRKIIWKSNSLNARDFLTAIKPYIVDKRMQKKIKILLNFFNYQQQNFRCTNNQVRKQMHKYYLQMKRLK